MKLAPYAVADRPANDKKESSRTVSQKDVEKITFLCKSFKRLDGKTQVLPAFAGDHYMTRLLHSMQVARVSRAIAKDTGTNQDLAEAIALAHDLGHPPFGHGGEEALDEVMKEYFEDMGFEHNEQSVRVVTELERAYPDKPGLGLSEETVEGLQKHQTVYDQHGKKFDRFSHLEGAIVNFADEIAYTGHDIDDSIRVGVLSVDDFRKNSALWLMAEREVIKEFGGTIRDKEDILIPRVISEVISILIKDVCRSTNLNLKRARIDSLEKVREHNDPLVAFSESVAKILGETREYLMDNFYMNPEILEKINEGKEKLKELFRHYMKNPADMYEDYEMDNNSLPQDKRELAIFVKDYIAGMTDSFLLKKWEEHILPLKSDQ